MTRTLYDQVQTKSQVLKLESDLEMARKERASLEKERVAWVADMKKSRKLENGLVEMEKAMAQIQNIHQKDLERKVAFCEAEKNRVAKEL